MRASNSYPNACLNVGWLVALCLVIDSAYAIDPNRAISQYVRGHWGVSEGFPGGPVYAITQTEDGYLWIGTEAGLVRFDGRNFRTVKDTSGKVSISSVRGLVPDRDGSLWIRLGDRGLVRYRDGVFEIPTPDREASRGVYVLDRNASGEILLAQMVDVIQGKAPGILVPMIFRDGKFQRMAAGSRALRSAVLAIAQTPNGDFWMGSRESGLFRFADGNMVGVKNGLPSLKINCLFSNGDRDVWIGTDDGVARWNGSSVETKGIPSLLSHVQALSIVMDRDANIWVGTDSRGLIRLNAEGLDSLHALDGESQEAVTALFEDREGNLWIGGPRGIERLGDSAFITYSTPEGLPTDGSNPVFVDTEDRLWFPPVSGGLWWAKGTGHGQVTLDGLDRDLIYSLAGGNRDLWIGRQKGGLTRLRLDGNKIDARTFTKSDGLAEDSVYSVYRARDGSVWAGTLSAGVSVLRNGKFTNYTADQGLASSTVASILEDSEGTMWFATPSGISSLSKGLWESYGGRDGLPSENIACLFQDSTGVLWTGTAAGIAFRDRGGFRVPPKPPPELSAPVLGIAEDRYGWLWIATSNRVLRVRREQLRSGSLGDGDLREYGIPDGLRGSEGVKRHQSVFRDHLDRIWFSLNRGISFVDPARLTRNSVPTIVHVQAVNGNPISIEKVTRVPGGQQRVTFSFAALSFSAADRIRYRYMLEGYDHDWSAPVAAREASYTNLSPRNYRFRVKASNPDGSWNPAESVIAIRVDPLFWQTWWFVSSVVLVVILLAVACYRIRINYVTKRLNLQFENRLTERIQVARDLHDTLLQTIQASKLVADDALSGRADQHRQRDTLEKLSGWLGQAIQEGRLALSSLRNSTTQQNDLAEAFRRAGEECKMERPIEFDLAVEGASRQMHPIVRDEVYRVGYEAIRNACTHSDASRLTVELSYVQNLILRVRDNGMGIPAEMVAKGKEGHFGLLGMRERAARLRAKLTFSSPGGSGTLVELIVPEKIAFRQGRPKRVVST
ncbi:MAG TPA: two-component regulator propeller domain-containing protein [Bryobacteraceae bacterium]|nr:two-component regulator propeller domain-containing protein [Bryobacteraceae bacterium]